MTAKEHYDNHLAHFYSWMMGDFEVRASEFKNFLNEHGIIPLENKIAVDLGAGHGIQSIPLADKGFDVIAVDFNEQLLLELTERSQNKSITTVQDDIRKVKQFVDQPELICCCGDTLSHLESKNEISVFISDIANSLAKNGKVILSFRDYSVPLNGTDRFIPVKSDDNRILTCILDYLEETVLVTDLFHERKGAAWEQKVSTYQKVRIKSSEIIDLLIDNGLSVNFNEVVNRLTTVIATKK